MKKRIALLLSLLMLSSSIISCSDEGQEDISNDTESADALQSESDVSVESDTVNERLLIDDELPDETFGGQDFIVLTARNFFIASEDLIGETVNDAVYNRNITLEDRFDIDFVVNEVDLNAIMSNIFKAVQAGTTDFHTVFHHAVYLGQSITKGYYINLNDLEYLDFDKPWWSPSTQDDLTVNGVTFLAVGDLALSSIGYTYCVFYDKVEAENYQIENLYNTVKEGKWTIDYLLGVAEGVTKDIDGNGVMDAEDYYGFSTNVLSNINTYLWAFGNKVFTKNSEGKMEYTFYSERTIETFDAIKRTVDSSFVYAPKVEDHGTAFPMFMDYKTLFVNSYIDNARSLGDYENEFGVLPYPKLDEEQDDYYTMVDGAHNAIAVANVPLDYDFVGIILEAMCAETYKTVVPEYLDVCLMKRYSSAPEDAEMIDKAVKSRVFDFGYVYDAWNGVSFLPQKIALNKRLEFTSYYEKSNKAIIISYNKFLDAFYDYEG